MTLTTTTSVMAITGRIGASTSKARSGDCRISRCNWLLALKLSVGKSRPSKVISNALVDAHADHPEFGYRFLADDLEHAGHHVGERRVWRLCRDQRLWSATTKKG